MKETLLVSFSGGRTSAFMTWWLMQNMADKYNFVVVFANTGKEREETLEFVRDCDVYFGFNTVWIETIMHQYKKGASFRIVNFETASRNGEPFEDVISKHGIPNQSSPHCTRELKASPIRAYMRSLGFKKSDYYIAIGYRHDEPKRINRKKQLKEKHIYPLVDFLPAHKAYVDWWWSKQAFNLKLKNYEGNCDLCWKKNENKLLTIIHETPEKVEWWEQMEKDYGMYTPDSRLHNPKIKPPHRFYRGNKSIEELKDATQKYFKHAKDDEVAKEIAIQTLLFSYGNGKESFCAKEACEPF